MGMSDKRWEEGRRERVETADNKEGGNASTSHTINASHWNAPLSVNYIYTRVPQSLLPLYQPDQPELFTLLKMPLNLSPYSTAEEMDRLELSDEDTEDLWDSPSKRGKKKVNQRPIKQERSPPPAESGRDEEPFLDRDEVREAALRKELQTVQNVNHVIEGLLGSLDKAKGNMHVRHLSCHCKAQLTIYRLFRKPSTPPLLYSTPGRVFYPRQSITKGSY